MYSMLVFVGVLCKNRIRIKRLTSRLRDFFFEAFTILKEKIEIVKCIFGGHHLQINILKKRSFKKKQQLWNYFKFIRFAHHGFTTQRKVTIVFLKIQIKCLCLTKSNCQMLVNVD